jgi:DNA sulfur modification protein DndC
VVEKDRSLQGFIDSGFKDLEPLADFRDWLKEFSRDPRNRMTERRNGNEGLGPFTMEARQHILQALLRIEKRVGYSLISEAEIRAINQIWRDDTSLLAHNRASRVLRIIGSQ